MSNYLRQVKTSLKVQPATTAKPEQLDHMTQAIKAAVMPEVAQQVREALQDLPALVAQRVDQTATQQISIQARKHAAGAFDESNSRLSRLEQAQQAPQVPMADADLDVRIRRQVADQLERQRPLVDPGEPMAHPPMPQAAKPMPVIEVQRGPDNRIRQMHIGKTTFTAERDSAGRISRIVPNED